MTGTEFETGRYLYCAVQATETDETDFSMTGIDDETARLITSKSADSLGVIVHECESLYDTAEETLLKKWLLQHQSVIDAAGETFGTPLPFQFDTILTGTDDRVRTWLDEESATFSRYLESLAGHWEYRIEVRCDETRIQAELDANDERLMELGERIEEASDGTKHLLEKQYEQRLAERKRQRREERATTLRERLEPPTREIHELDARQPVLIEQGRSMATETDSMDTQARFAVLATAEQENAIGEQLDEVAAESGVEVRFTGPWPPYTFTPTIGGEDETNAGH